MASNNGYKSGLANTITNNVNAYSALQSATTNTYNPNLCMTSTSTTLGGTYVYPSSVIGDYSIFMDSSKQGLIKFAEYILLSKTEQELKDILTEIKASIRNLEDSNYADNMFSMIICDIISLRHFSEEFILDYLDDIVGYSQKGVKEIIFKNHKADILSKSYSTLALKLLLDDNDNP